MADKKTRREHNQSVYAFLLTLLNKSFKQKKVADKRVKQSWLFESPSVNMKLMSCQLSFIPYA